MFAFGLPLLTARGPECRNSTASTVNSVEAETLRRCVDGDRAVCCAELSACHVRSPRMRVGSSSADTMPDLTDTLYQATLSRTGLCP